MTAADMAALHARCFDEAPRPWRAEEFAACLDDPAMILCQDAHGFCLLRRAGPEGEILTIAVAPERRRTGLGRRLLARSEAQAAAAGVAEVFLEVAVTNAAAKALYAASGYAEVGRRADYYRPRSSQPIDALILSKHLRVA